MHTELLTLGDSLINMSTDGYLPPNGRFTENNERGDAIVKGLKRYAITLGSTKDACSTLFVKPYRPYSNVRG